MLLTIKDGATGNPISGATVLVRLNTDNTVVTSGSTGTDGTIDVAATAPSNVLAYKTGSYAGAKVDVVVRDGVLFPSTISLLPVTSRLMKLSIFEGDYSTPLGGARVEVKNAGGTSQFVANAGSDGKYQATLQADLTGWTVTVTSPGIDGVVLPLEKIDFVGEERIVLAPTS